MVQVCIPGYDNLYYYDYILYIIFILYKYIYIILRREQIVIVRVTISRFRTYIPTFSTTFSTGLSTTRSLQSRACRTPWVPSPVDVPTSVLSSPPHHYLLTT
nr:MAG TPA: hypothetical protein [Caudoviricetes sp.]